MIGKTLFSSLFKNWTVYLILFVVSVLAFFQIFFYMNPTKWDMLNCFLPWKFYVGECLQNGNLPLWNPYVNLGAPINADPSSNAWYPVTWLIGYFKGYSVYTIGFELWLHVFLAGIGFYKLCKTLHLSSVLALTGGVAFMLSGLFIGNAQHLPYIISACWLPFVIHYYLKFVQEDSWENVVKASLALFMMLTGGYPAFTFILFYLLIIFFIYYALKKERRKGSLKSLFVKNIAFVGLAILASTVMIVSVYQAMPYISRLESLTVQHALYSPFSPQSFVSFIFPYATTVRLEYFDSDLSMRNAYFGLIPFLLFILGMFIKKKAEVKILFWFGLLCLTAAVGNYLPVREFLYNYIPFMNLFRFPSVFRLFVIIAGVITGLHFLQVVLSGKVSLKKVLLIGTGTSIVALIIVLNYALNFEHFNISKYLSDNLFVVTEEATYWKTIAVQSLFQLFILLCFLVLIWRIKRKTILAYSILVLISFDLIITAQLNAPTTVYYHKWTAQEAENIISAYPKGFPKLDTVSLIENDNSERIGDPFFLNTNIYRKQIGTVGFNSFMFGSYDILRSDYPAFYDELKKNKLLLLSDEIYPIAEMDKFRKDSLFSSKQLFFEQKTLEKLQKGQFLTKNDDFAQLNDFGAFYFEVKTKTSEKQILTLFQKNYPGWTATLNDSPVEIYTSNMNFMSVVLPGGENKVRFEFKNRPVTVSFWVSLVTLLFMASFLVFAHYQKTINQNN